MVVDRGKEKNGFQELNSPDHRACHMWTDGTRKHAGLNINGIAFFYVAQVSKPTGVYCSANVVLYSFYNRIDTYD
jgi:hypothetical protein